MKKNWKYNFSKCGALTKQKKIICFDIDNVIFKTKGNNYVSSKPIKKAILKINELHEKGHIIKLHTARYMGRNNENVKKAKKQGYNITHKQLKKFGVKFLVHIYYHLKQIVYL